ncbi:hypothetical protein [Paractinoplanes globisporus]|uniref:Uncharacterized protein n=1 Tax=Paractinoplanes globisporus TaxID=113565 RepID=A0ABW6WJ51_9ACTN|nr:hypothetical protein [Actinoplanes globisporus]
MADDAPDTSAARLAAIAARLGLTAPGWTPQDETGYQDWMAADDAALSKALARCAPRAA